MAGSGTRGQEVVLDIEGLTVGFGGTDILDGLVLRAWRGEVLGLVGASGAGKSVLLRAILGLVPVKAGSVSMFGIRYDNATAKVRTAIERRIGVMFQHGALFSSLTVLENIELPMREYLRLPQRLMDELARLKLELVGLPSSAAAKMPSELSGGMIKRASLARAIALDPELLFLDEPTSGLDPIGAAEFDELISTLRDTLDLTVFMVTHDLDSIHTVCDRVACLARGRIIVEGPLATVMAFDDAWVQSYFRGARGRAVPA